MILACQQAVESALVSADMSAAVASVNAKYIATGVTIHVPAANNIYPYEHETVRTDSNQMAVFVLPQNTEYRPYSSSGKVLAAHLIYIIFVMRDQSPGKLNTAKMMIAEAAAPVLTKLVRNGGTRHQSIITRADYLPLVADGPFRITDITLSLDVHEIISAEEVDV